MEIIGRMSGENLVELWEWVQSLSLSPTAIQSRYAPNRSVKCFGVASNLQSIAKGRARLLRTDDPGERIRSLGERLLPGWHSLLVCGGDTTIHWHRDHGHFEGIAVMINLGEALYFERDYEQGELQHHLTDGLVIRINTKLLHQAIPRSTPRYNLTFRHLKPQFLPQVEESQATQLQLPM
ncbi:hypothetical protein [Leptolyngbya sp. FACHB-711]|uniref:hypothetical protein n=1 Tax=unclassified Leptolyngbya TaxID=2650499 RepID=UPI0016866CC7|nr:hypothetical protein [Leptolyngbya sp. FACHB-711]MBD1851746.1 hypothetical protein [Cyanobacteria bacterium FACHB-502]MBD2022867.1 hypothetical protein [Leptolyngbya sp. FACHB-711]